MQRIKQLTGVVVVWDVAFQRDGIGSEQYLFILEKEIYRTCRMSGSVNYFCGLVIPKIKNLPVFNKFINCYRPVNQCAETGNGPLFFLCGDVFNLCFFSGVSQNFATSQFLYPVSTANMVGVRMR